MATKVSGPCSEMPWIRVGPTAWIGPALSRRGASSSGWAWTTPTPAAALA